MSIRKIKNTTEAGRGKAEGLQFPAGVVTEVDAAVLTEFRKEPIHEGWFASGDLLDVTTDPTAPKADAKVEPKKDDGKK